MTVRTPGDLMLDGLDGVPEINLTPRKPVNVDELREMMTERFKGTTNTPKTRLAIQSWIIETLNAVSAHEFIEPVKWRVDVSGEGNDVSLFIVPEALYGRATHWEDRNGVTPSSIRSRVCRPGACVTSRPSPGTPSSWRRTSRPRSTS